ncbi:MAG: DUF3843 family protein [Mediterranea sp.]|jgi:hypothetical protein|nr:DUF3843 family protein [Mediterranea sp.]
MKISTTYWRLYHPIGEEYASDFYYTKIANEVFSRMRPDPVLAGMYTDYAMRETAMRVSLYFEDVISDFGIWRSFVTKHRELYGKSLPFFEVDEADYYTNEIHREDIQLLLWMGLQEACDDRIFNPVSKKLEALAERLFLLLDGEFEKAPVNEKLVEHFYEVSGTDTFLRARILCIALHSSCYLFDKKRIFDIRREVIRQYQETWKGEEESQIAHSMADNVLPVDMPVGPLSLTSFAWIGQMMKSRGDTERGDRFAGMECRKFTSYRLERFDDRVAMLTDAEGETFMVDRNSIWLASEEPPKGAITVLCVLARYNSELWVMTGGYLNTEDDSSFVQYRKELLEEKEKIAKTYRGLMDSNGGHPLVYFADYAEMEGWFGKHPELTLQEDSLEEFGKDTRFAMFIDEEAAMMIVPGAARWIKDERNPYYDAEWAANAALRLFLEPDKFSREMRRYLVENRMIPDANISEYDGEKGRRLTQDNLDFLARFFFKEQY